ncbi:MAG TPA: sensor histidine kinase, partial [Anaerolineales bacterium]|nr:sensor histidine kinase [Anaerolineales bacterium]
SQADLAQAFASHVAVAIENARLYEQAQSLASIQERQKLARELHDSVSQALYGIALGARTARTMLDRQEKSSDFKDPLEEPLDYVLELADAGLAEMRALIFELRPESLESEGLVIALTKQAAALKARYQLNVVTEFCPEPDISLLAKETLFRISQEATHNTVKHAGATKIHLSLTEQDHLLSLVIRDDGRGFNSGGDFPGHLGLRSMRERMERIGGSLNITTSPGKGTTITAQYTES